MDPRSETRRKSRTTVSSERNTPRKEASDVVQVLSVEVIPSPVQVRVWACLGQSGPLLGWNRRVPCRSRPLYEPGQSWAKAGSFLAPRCVDGVHPSSASFPKELLSDLFRSACSLRDRLHHPGFVVAKHCQALAVPDPLSL